MISCVRYLDYTIEEFEKLDIPDYMMLMEAVQYRARDTRQRIRNSSSSGMKRRR